MKNRLYYAIKDIKRNLPLIIIFIGQLTISIFFIFLCITQLITNQQYRNHIKKLSDYNLINFNAYYGVESMKVTPKMKEMLTDILDNKHQAFSVIENIQFSEYPKLNIVVGLGKFGEIFGLEQDQIQENVNSHNIKVFIGSKINNVNIGETIKFGLSGNEELIVNGKLPRNASYLRGQNVVNLDNSIVILTTFEKLTESYHNYYTEATITNMGLFNPTDEEINEFVRTISESEMLNLSPNRFNSNASTIYRDLMQNITFFLLFFLCTVIFIAVGIISSLLTLIDHNLQEYAIHHLYGATLGDLHWRTVIYVMAIIILPLIFAATLISQSGVIGYTSPLLIVLLVGIVTASQSIFPLSKLKKQDMTFYLRRDY